MRKRENAIICPRCQCCIIALGEMGFQLLQSQVKEWTAHNFPFTLSHHPLLGAMEELGELAHAHLKNEQGIRTDECHLENKCDAIGDIIIYLADYCNREGIDLQEAVAVTWAKVQKRDWIKDPKNGTDSPT